MSVTILKSLSADDNAKTTGTIDFMVTVEDSITVPRRPQKGHFPAPFVYNHA
jgi:hypothetical protein